MKKISVLFILFLLLITRAEAKIYAVVVGIEKYDGTVKNLISSVSDAKKVYRYLKSNKQNKVVLLTDKQATKQNILYAMKKVYRLAKANDMILFYFSGHGSKGMFCPTNVRFGKNGLLYTEVSKAFKLSKAKNKLCIADACFSGGIVKKRQSAHSIIQGKNKENIVIFASSRENEMSIESFLANGGIFTSFFLKGMRGNADFNKDRKVSLFELYAYVRRKVRKFTKNKQTPIMYGHFNKSAIISNY